MRPEGPQGLGSAQFPESIQEAQDRKTLTALYVAQAEARLSLGRPRLNSNGESLVQGQGSE